MKKKNANIFKIIGLITIIVVIMLIFLKSCSNNEMKIAFTGEKIISVEYGNVFNPNVIKVLKNGQEIDVNPVIDLSNVNYHELGKYPVTIKYVDESGNIIYEEKRFIEIKDTTPPEILLKGSKSLTIPINSSYSDAGYEVSDNHDASKDIKISHYSNVDSTKVGVYKVTYIATDSSGNKSQVTRTVIVEQSSEVTNQNGSDSDSTNNNSNNSNNNPKPVGITTLQLKGTSTVYLEYLNNYVEAGYSAIDTIDKDLTNKVNVTGTVNSNKLGTYELIYSVTNSSGKTTTVKRTVIVRDQTAPQITINGTNPINHEVKTPYTDLGAFASDNHDSVVSVDVNSTVNINKIGEYQVTYTATDSSGNASQVYRTVKIVDQTAPEIVISETNATVTIGQNAIISNLKDFMMNGVSVTDNYDADLIDGVTYLSNPNFDITTIGTYVITYKVSDKSGNEAIPKTKTINVVDMSAPVGDVNYSTTNPTNQNVTATITADKTLKAIDTWTRINDTTYEKVFDDNWSGNVIICNTYDVCSNVNVTISNIDKEAITATPSYSITTLTNQDVVVTITTNKLINTPAEWSKITDTTYQKTYTANASETIGLSDAAGNTAAVDINISNIDKEAITATPSYSITAMTTQDVVVTITTNKLINTPAEWSKITDTTYQKTYSANASETISLSDAAGNIGSVDITVANIDKTPPNTYSLNSNTTSTDSITINGSATDNLSGVCHYAFSKNGGAYSANQTSPNFTFSSLSEDTTYTIQVKVIDCVGLENTEYTVNIKTDKLVKEKFYARVTSHNNPSDWTHADDVLTNTNNTTYHAYKEKTLCVAGSSCKINGTIIYTMANIGTTNAFTNTDFDTKITIPTAAEIKSATMYYALGLQSGSSLYSASGPAEIKGPIATQTNTITSGKNSLSWHKGSATITTLPALGSAQDYECYLENQTGFGSGSVRLLVSYIYAEFNVQWLEKGGIV